MAKIPAHTPVEIAIKAKLVTVANAVMGETWYTEKLQASVMRNLAKQV